MRFSLQTLLLLTLLVAVFLGLRAFSFTQGELLVVFTIQLVPSVMALITAVTVAARSRRFRTPVLAAAAAALLSSLALAIEIGESLRRDTYGQYFDWFRGEDLRLVAAAVLSHTTMGVAIGTSVAALFYLAGCAFRRESRQES